MAVLDIPELQQQLQMDEAMVRRSAHDVQRAEQELSRAQSDYSVAHVTYDRAAGVQQTQPQLIAQEELDVAQGKDQSSKAAVSANAIFPRRGSTSTGGVEGGA